MGAIYLIRHGQASVGAGDYDKLSKLGVEQAYVLGQALVTRGVKPDLVVCGDMLRHRETAAGCLAAMGLPGQWQTDAAWNEYDHEMMIEAYRPRFRNKALMMAEALPDDGELTTCDVNPEAEAVAKRFFAQSPHGKKLRIRMGPALQTLELLSGPFDLVFIDADKPGNAVYFDHAVALSRSGTMILVDNVVRDGGVLDPNGDAAIKGTRALFDALARDERVTATALQTVGAKKWDGFVMAVVR